MVQGKDVWYWSQLRAALTSGQWLSGFPARAPNGSLLSWSELLRKFNKHCKGFVDVSEIASQTQALSLLLIANNLDEDQDVIGNLVPPPLDINGEVLLLVERVEEAKAGYDTLKRIESEDSNSHSVHFALSYYAYAMGRPTECLSHLERVSDLLNIQSHIPSIGSTRSSTNTNLLAPGTSAHPSMSSVSISASFTSIVDLSAPEIKDGRGWALTETFRSVCLQGMANERLFPSAPQRALSAYQTAVPLFSILNSEFTLSSAVNSTGKPDFTPFTQLHELWRWIERLLWRAIVLSAQTSNVHSDSGPDTLWLWLGHYSACSICWPPSFRTAHRAAISTIYLRSLILRNGTISPTSSANTNLTSLKWVHLARTVAQDYRAILSASTTFPKATEINIKVEDFVDLCVAVWEAAGSIGSHAGWVIDILWWATRLTFNSSRILRHMTRLLHLSGDTALAKRTLKLYVQVVGKAYQASKEGIGEDTDTDESWVETLVFGARMYCRSADTIHDVHQARTLIEKARTRLNPVAKRLVAAVELAEGIYFSILALHEQDPHSRAERFSRSHSQLLQSVEVYPTAGGHFHLALSFARPGHVQSLKQAIECAGLAVESDSKDVRYWHLLGLLLSAVERWREAAEILEHGAELGEPSEPEAGVDDDLGKMALMAPTNGSESVPGTNGEVKAIDFAPAIHSGTGSQQSDELTNGNNAQLGNNSNIPSPAYVLDSGTEMPPSTGLLNSILHPSPCSKPDLFEQSLQLRMTQAALIEVMEGAEGAEKKWVDVFAWIAENKRMSNDVLPSASPGIFKAYSEHSEKQHAGTAADEEKSELAHLRHRANSASETSHSSDQLQAPAAIPITITEATPDVERTQAEADISSQSESKRAMNGLRVRRSTSTDRDPTKSKKKVGQMLKLGVNKGSRRITAVSRKIGNGVVNGSLRRSNSAPDFHAVLRSSTYQASSIHSRKRLSVIHSDDRTPTDSPPPPPRPPIPPAHDFKLNSLLARENRLLSDLWLMSAATFRRLGKIEQAKGAIQEAEVRDENNPAVWVQLGLYYAALGHHQDAIDALQKALFIEPDDISATVHLGRLYLEGKRKSTDVSSSDVDLAAGMLAHLTRGRGWDVAEAWYFLGKAYSKQGRKQREREALKYALELSENRCVRDIGLALGWCIY